jgi:hypothetical protein
MAFRCICLVLICALFPSLSFAQTALGEIEIEEYLHSAKLNCDSYMLTAKVEFSTEPGHALSCSGTEEFVELVSKSDGIVWRRAHRDAKPHELTPDDAYPCMSFSRQWCRLNVGKDLFGIAAEWNNANRDPFQFAMVKSIDPGCLVFPELFDSPFLDGSGRDRTDVGSMASRLATNLTCIHANAKGDAVTSS